MRFSGIFIEEASTTYESVCMRISTLELRPSQLVFSGELGPRRGILVLQASYNLALALIGLALLAIWFAQRKLGVFVLLQDIGAWVAAPIAAPFPPPAMRNTSP